MEGEEERGQRYFKAIDKQTDGAFLTWLSGLGASAAERVIVFYEEGGWDLISALEEDAFGKDIEAPALLNLDASAAVIAKAVAPRKLFTLMPPPGFR